MLAAPGWMQRRRGKAGLPAWRRAAADDLHTRLREATSTHTGLTPPLVPATAAQGQADLWQGRSG